jgi:hypothetical protein
MRTPSRGYGIRLIRAYDDSVAETLRRPLDLINARRHRPEERQELAAWSASRRHFSR